MSSWGTSVQQAVVNRARVVDRLEVSYCIIVLSVLPTIESAQPAAF
jgi:hypothetical protein